MEVIVDTIKEFDVFKGTSRAGKPYSVNLAVFEEFGVVSLGFNKPDALGLKVGEKVAIEIEKKFGKWEYQRQVDIDTESTLTMPPVVSGPMVVSAGAPRGSYTAKPFPVPDNHGDMSIIHQNSLSNALRYFELQQQYGAPEEQPTPEQVIKLAYEFADFSSGKHLERMAKEK